MVSLNPIRYTSLCVFFALILSGCTIFSSNTPASRLTQEALTTLESNHSIETTIELGPSNPVSITASPLHLQTPEITITPSPTITQKPLPLMEGNLDDQIVDLERDSPRPSSNGFIHPDDKAMIDFAQIIKEILAGNTQAAAQISSQYGYELVIYRDQGDMNHESYLLHEQIPIHLGWGLYVLSPASCGKDANTIILEAPHILADEYTPKIALDAFRALHGCALLVGGAHRDANRDGSADVAHNPLTIFQAIHEYLAEVGESVLILQFHGFASYRHPGYPAAVLGGKPDNDIILTELLSKITTNLENQGITSGVCNQEYLSALCGETNIQSNNLPDGLFIHLELDEIIRSAPGPLISSLVEVLMIR